VNDGMGSQLSQASVLTYPPLGGQNRLSATMSDVDVLCASLLPGLTNVSLHNSAPNGAAKTFGFDRCSAWRAVVSASLAPLSYAMFQVVPCVHLSAYSLAFIGITHSQCLSSLGTAGNVLLFRVLAGSVHRRLLNMRECDSCLLAFPACADAVMMSCCHGTAVRNLCNGRLSTADFQWQ
jgi:hypothetical protein